MNLPSDVFTRSGSHWAAQRRVPPLPPAGWQLDTGSVSCPIMLRFFLRIFHRSPGIRSTRSSRLFAISPNIYGCKCRLSAESFLASLAVH
jgi:hypothetical protein